MYAQKKAPQYCAALFLFPGEFCLTYDFRQLDQVIRLMQQTKHETGWRIHYFAAGIRAVGSVQVGDIRPHLQTAQTDAPALFQSLTTFLNRRNLFPGSLVARAAMIGNAPGQFGSQGC